MIKRLFVFISFLTLGVISTRASLYRIYQTSNGLSHNSVWAVMQDSEGFMWFGTNDGLNRFDGVHFKVFRRQSNDTTSIGNNFIHCLLEDKSGHILVGTKEGLYYYTRETESFTHISLNGKPIGADKTSIHGIVEDKSGDIWLGCYGQGIYRIGADYRVKQHYESELPTPYINTLALDMAGNVWAGTDGKGLFCLMPDTGKVVTSAIDKFSILSIYCDNNNTLWIGTNTTGLIHYDHRTKTQKTLQVKQGSSARTVYNIKSITPFQNNVLVMSSESGLLKVDCQTEELKAFDGDGTSYDNLPDYSIFSIAKDNEGGLWLGTYFYGVCYWSPNINTFSYYAPRKGSSKWSNSIIKRIVQGTGNDVWLSTRNYGLVRFNSVDETYSPFNVAGLSFNVQEMLADGPLLWINDYDRCLVAVDIASGRVVHKFTTENGLPSNIVNSMCKTTQGLIYIGTSKGVCVYDGSVLRRLTEIPAASVMKIIEDYKGNIWMATHFHGIFRLSANRKVTQYRHQVNNPHSLMGNNVNTIFQDTRGNIWVGTEGEGLGMMNPETGRIERQFRKSDGMPSNIIYGILEDVAGNIWVSTGDGLIKIDSQHFSIRHFRYIESLVDIHYLHNSCLRGSDDRLYFGGSNGYIVFDPQKLYDNQVPPIVHFTDLYINGQRMTPQTEGSPLSKPIDQTKAIELSASQSTFSFDIACLGYLSPEYNTVSYMLEGYDRDWQTLTNGNRHILYMNLPAGEYRLVVKGINNDGMESEPIALDIQVNRPFLLSRFMLFVYLLAALCLIAYAIRRYKRRLEAANQERMLKFSLDKEKELYEAKIGFFTNIAHEIRTPLSLISAPLDAILSSNEANQKTRSNLAIMKSNVQRLLELVNQLLDFRKVESQLMKLNVQSCRVSDVVMSICHRYEEYLRVHHLEMDTTGVQPGILCNLDQEAFVKMIGNLMSNAIKYAKKHISLTLQIRQDDNMLQFEITDDGPGIREEEQPKVFESFYQVDDHGKRPGSGLGLPLALNLAKMHGGSITLHSVYGEGSRFTLTLPMTLETQESLEEKPSTTVEETVEKNSEPQDVVQVLIVEDNDELRDFVINNLGHPYHVFGAEHGIEALQQLENHSIDVIVSDIMMPEMDGLELCRVIKQNEAYAHIPIILLSAKTDMETKVAGLDIGAAAYLEKPFSMEQLRAQVNSIIENRNRLRERFIKSPLDFYKKPSADDAEERLNAEFVNKLNTLILDNLMNKDFSIDNLARMFYMSRSNFHKRVKGVTGETPNDYIRIVRLNKSAELLATGKYQIVEVCYMVGFNTPSYFSKCFQEHFHKLPKEYLNDL